MHKGWVKFSWAVLGVVLAVGLFFHVILFKIPRQKIQAIEAGLAEDGKAMSFSDLAPDPIPVSENAAPLYLEAYQILESLEHEGENVFFFKTEFRRPDPEPGVRQAFEILLWDSEYRKAMLILDQASLLEKCQFNLKYTNAADMLVPHVTPMLNLSQLMLAQIELQIGRGDLEGAVQSLNRLSALASGLDQEPILISQLVRTANIAIYIEALNLTLGHQKVGSSFLAEVESQLTRFPPDTLSPQWMNAERIFYMELWRSGEYMSMSGYTGFWDDFSDIGAAAMFISHLATTALDELNYLENWLMLESEFAKPHYDVDWNSLEQKLLEELPTPYILSRESFTTTCSAHKKIISGDGLLQLARVAVDLYQLRLDSGEFPGDLSGFAAELIRDPFSGEQLKYEKTAEGFRLYSVGPNLMDDNGSKDRKTDEDDLLWSHPYQKL